MVLLELQEICNNIESGLVSKMILYNRKIIQKLVTVKRENGRLKNYARPKDTDILTNLILYKGPLFTLHNNTSIMPSFADDLSLSNKLFHKTKITLVVPSL